MVTSSGLKHETKAPEHLKEWLQQHEERDLVGVEGRLKTTKDVRNEVGETKPTCLPRRPTNATIPRRVCRATLSYVGEVSSITARVGR